MCRAVPLTLGMQRQDHLDHPPPQLQPPQRHRPNPHPATRRSSARPPPRHASLRNKLAQPCYSGAHVARFIPPASWRRFGLSVLSATPPPLVMPRALPYTWVGLLLQGYYNSRQLLHPCLPQRSTHVHSHTTHIDVVARLRAAAAAPNACTASGSCIHCRGGLPWQRRTRLSVMHALVGL